MSYNYYTQNGKRRVNVTCQDCSGTKVFECTSKNDGYVNKKITKSEWEIIKGSIFCPSCVKKRKLDTAMKQAKITKHVNPTDTLRKPTLQQKRDIISMLELSYDTKSECYIQGETDQTVSDGVGNVLVGWVVELREEFFGPSGTNEDMEALKKECADFVAKAEAHLKASLDVTSKLTADISKVKAMQSQLDKIKTAVGARIVGRL